MSATLEVIIVITCLVVIWHLAPRLIRAVWKTIWILLLVVAAALAVFVGIVVFEVDLTALRRLRGDVQPLLPVLWVWIVLYVLYVVLRQGFVQVDRRWGKWTERRRQRQAEAQALQGIMHAECRDKGSTLCNDCQGLLTMWTLRWGPRRARRRMRCTLTKIGAPVPSPSNVQGDDEAFWGRDGGFLVWLTHHRPRPLSDPQNRHPTWTG